MTKSLDGHLECQATISKHKFSHDTNNYAIFWSKLQSVKLKIESSVTFCDWLVVNTVWRMLFKVSFEPPPQSGVGCDQKHLYNLKKLWQFPSQQWSLFFSAVDVCNEIRKKSAITRSSIGEHSCVKSTSYTWYQNLSCMLIHFVLKTFNINYLNDNKTNNRPIFLPGNANSITNYKSNFTVAGKILFKNTLRKKTHWLSLKLCSISFTKIAKLPDMIQRH